MHTHFKREEFNLIGQKRFKSIGRLAVIGTITSLTCVILLFRCKEIKEMKYEKRNR